MGTARPRRRGRSPGRSCPARARPVDPRQGGRPSRGAGRPRRGVQVHGLDGLRPDQGRAHRMGPARAGWHHAGLAVPGRSFLPDALRLPGRAGPGRLWRHDRRQARVHRPGPGSGESADTWAEFPADLKDCGLPPAAGHLRWRARPKSEPQRRTEFHRPPVNSRVNRFRGTGSWAPFPDAAQSRLAWRARAATGVADRLLPGSADCTGTTQGL